jgi:bifunctional oligoribonuclease and PAP phosphatase NrnA
MSQTTTDIAAVAGALRAGERFLVTSHENPDGDALGSLLAMHLALVELGKDSVMVLAGAQPLPAEYSFLDLSSHGLLRDVPADADKRILVAVDCAQETRLTDDRLLSAATVVNIDHHHDNTLFGTANLVVGEASSTAEVLADVFADLEVVLTPAIATGLYAGLVTDTGRFQYSNTTPKALRLAAQLVEAGADLQQIFQGVYESMPFPKMLLLARALDRAALYEDGRVVVSYLVRSDFGEVGAVEPYSEGVIDVLRAVEGVELAALIREPPRDGSPARKISLRSSSERVDVSAIARASGGGGHRQAAGFSSDLSIDEITAFIVAAYAALPAASS